jgi:hypothetical protein
MKNIFIGKACSGIFGSGTERLFGKINGDKYIYFRKNKNE